MLPVFTNLRWIVYTEPTGPPRINSIWIPRNYFQVDTVSELETMIVRSHVFMPRSERHLDSKAIANMGDPFAQGWCDDGKVIES